MLSRKEIALRAGVSKTTVTRVLAGDETVLPENRKKIMQIVEDSGYTRNVLAANLAKKQAQYGCRHARTRHDKLLLHADVQRNGVMCA